jgi:outer membrane protein assembly factor BamB
MNPFRQRGMSTLPGGILVLLVIASSAMSADNWPQFRGSASLGIDDGNKIPDRWSATKNVAWKSDLPGRGWSSPIVWGDRVFLTTVVNQGTSEAPKKGLYFGGNRPKPPESFHEWRVLCLDLTSGKFLWNRQIHTGKPESSIHLKNSFASETPVTDGEHVYCYFGNVGIFCLDFEGKLLWSRKLKSHKTRFGWGTAASPVLHKDRLYLINDNDESSYLLAIDKKTGNEVWRVDRDEKSNWATPYVWVNDQRSEIITPGTGRVRSYDLDGKLLWTLRGMSSITIAMPYQSEGLLYVTSGYVLDPNKPVYAIRSGARGDISLKKGENSNEWIVWSRKDIAPYNPSTLTYHGLLYVLYDRGLFASFNASDGSPVYSRRRIPNGRVFTSSPWASNGKIFCLNEDGVTTVIREGADFEVLRTNRLADDDMCMATPAIAGDRLLIRTSARLYCIRESSIK